MAGPPQPNRDHHLAAALCIFSESFHARTVAKSSARPVLSLTKSSIDHDIMRSLRHRRCLARSSLLCRIETRAQPSILSPAPSSPRSLSSTSDCPVRWATYRAVRAKDRSVRRSAPTLRARHNPKSMRDITRVLRCQRLRHECRHGRVGGQVLSRVVCREPNRHVTSSIQRAAVSPY